MCSSGSCISTYGRISYRRRALPDHSEPLPCEMGFEYGRVVVVWATERAKSRTLICKDCERDGGFIFARLVVRTVHSTLENPGRGPEERTASRLRILSWIGPALGTCHNAQLLSALWLCQLTGSRLVSPCNSSISFPVRCQSSVKVLLSKVQLQSIHPHSRCDIYPSPEVTSSITSLTGPPVTVAAISA